MTTRELAKVVNVSESAAKGIMAILEENDAATFNTFKLNPGVTRGAPAKDYNVDFSKASEILANLSRGLKDL